MRLKSDSVKLNFWQKVGLESMWVLCKGISILPYVVQYYVIQELVYFIVYHCVRYRRKLVNQNLRNSFPEKSDAEIAVIRRKFYRNLAEVIINTLVMARMDEAECKRRMVFTTPSPFQWCWQCSWHGCHSRSRYRSTDQPTERSGSKYRYR